MSAPATLLPTSLPLDSLVQLNAIPMNRILILSITLLVFALTLLIRKGDTKETRRSLLGTIKLTLFGFILLGVETVFGTQNTIGYALEKLQIVVVLLCLAQLTILVFADFYLRVKLRHEVPSLLRDMVRLLVYLIAAIISLRLVFQIDISTIITTTTVITAALAFALQNTLANALSGFSIQSDNLLEPHTWITINEKNLFGEVINVGFRYTSLRTLEQNIVMVPNSVIMQNLVTVHGNVESEYKPAILVRIMLAYAMPPELARATLLQVLRDDPGVLQEPAPIVRLLSLDDSGITYQMRFWIDDPTQRVPVQDSIYTQAWYAIQRTGYPFPFPHRHLVTTAEPEPFTFSPEQIDALLRSCDLLAILDPEVITTLGTQVALQVYGPNEIIVHQGQPGSSLFLVARGALEVTVDNLVVGAITADSFFGEMSLMTGAPRSATVRSRSEVWLIEITKETMQPLIQAHPQILEHISAILAQREHATSESKQLHQNAPHKHKQEDYLHLLREFFRI